MALDVVSKQSILTMQTCYSNHEESETKFSDYKCDDDFLSNSTVSLVDIPEVPSRIIFHYLSVDDLESLSQVNSHFYCLIHNLFELNVILHGERKCLDNKPVLRLLYEVLDQSPFSQNQEELNKEIELNQVLTKLNLTKLREVKFIPVDVKAVPLYEPIVFREPVFLDILGRMRDIHKLGNVRKIEMAVNDRSVPSGVFKLLGQMPNLRDLNLDVFVPEVMPTTRGRTRQTYALMDLFDAIFSVPSIKNLSLRIIKAPIQGLCVTLVNDNIESFKLEASESFEDGSRIEFKNLKYFECKALVKYGTSRESVPIQERLILDFKLENKMICSYFQSQTEYVYYKYKDSFEDRLRMYNGVDISNIAPNLTYAQYVEELTPRFYASFVSRHNKLQIQEEIMTRDEFEQKVFNNEIIGRNCYHLNDIVNDDEVDNHLDGDIDDEDGPSLFDIYNNDQWDAVQVDEDADSDDSDDNLECNLM